MRNFDQSFSSCDTISGYEPYPDSSRAKFLFQRRCELGLEGGADRSNTAYGEWGGGRVVAVWLGQVGTE